MLLKLHFHYRIELNSLLIEIQLEPLKTLQNVNKDETIPKIVENVS